MAVHRNIWQDLPTRARLRAKYCRLCGLMALSFRTFVPTLLEAGESARPDIPCQEIQGLACVQRRSTMCSGNRLGARPPKQMLVSWTGRDSKTGKRRCDLKHKAGLPRSCICAGLSADAISVKRQASVIGGRDPGSCGAAMCPCYPNVA